MINEQQINSKVNTTKLKRIVPLFCLFLILFLINGCKDCTDAKMKIETVAEGTSEVKEKWHWDNPEKQNEGAGYAQVVKVGNTIYISGVPTDDLSPDGISRLYKTLGECLSAFGATYEDVVKETLYTTDIEEMKKYNDERKDFYQGDYPAASWVQVVRLYEPSAKLEVDLIAEITDSPK